MTHAEHAVRARVRNQRAAPDRLRIRCRPEDVSRARHWFRRCLHGWPDDDIATAESVFGEVAANAVQHGRGRITVTVALAGSDLRCEVSDGSWRRPRCLTGGSPDNEFGRGMIIVAALADDWGVRRHLRGKTIWFDVRSPGPA
jgi:anti-sigma regulatory factor (Ser/Thr protein kinase)